MQHLHIQSQRISYPESSYRNAQCSTQISLQSMFWNTKERYPLKSHLRKEHGISIKKSEKYTLHECGICYFKKSREEFEIHVSTIHPEFNIIVMLNRNAEPQLRPKFKTCKFCKKDFTTSELAATKLIMWLMPI